MKAFIEDLKRIGFGTDRPISGSDAVDVICTHWDTIKEPPVVTIHILHGTVERATASAPGVCVTVIDHDIPEIDEPTPETTRTYTATVEHRS